MLQFTVGTGGEGPGEEQFTQAEQGREGSRSRTIGFLRVDVSRTGVRYRFVDERGRVLDRWPRP